MERPSTPPNAGPPATTTRSPMTPEVKRRIEENRLRAKARREQLEAEQRQSAPPTSRTPSGFVVSSSTTAAADPNSLAGRKRAHATISNVPESNRDARNEGSGSGAGGFSKPAGDGAIQPARKFAKYIEYDFSKMVDTKGGFLTAEDDPHNKILNTTPAGPVEQKPAHMSLKEWERHQLLKSLRERKEGPFEPGLSVLQPGMGSKCRECGSLEVDFQWVEVFGCAVCKMCKEKFPDKYSLLTKTEAKEDYLLTDPELKDEELLPHLNKPNPHKSHWHDMMLFLRYQVEEYAFSKKWGSAEALDAEFEKREADKKRRKEEKFRTKLQELKKKTRAEAYRRNLKAGGSGGAFGDRIGGGKHEHSWGQTVENEDGMSVKTCLECGMEVEELEF